MIDKVNNKGMQVFLITLHLIIGFIGAKSAIVVAFFYAFMLLYFMYDIMITADKGSRAGFYAIYMMGFEIVYRISGSALMDEMGKYACITLVFCGLVVGRRKYIAMAFVFVLILLIPSVFLTESESSVWTRKIIMANISGPLSIVFTGLYFYKRKVSSTDYSNGMLLAFYPAFALLMILTIKSGLSEVEFNSVSSKSATSGGFGANQVSSGLGWFILLGLLELIRGRRLAFFLLFDVLVLTYLLIRGLLTMSRGGIMSAFLALFVVLVYYIWKDQAIRVRIRKWILPILSVILILFGGIWFANKLSNNYILYRYQGKSTKEVKLGIEDEDKSYLTGREEISEGDFAAFNAFPILGVGYGMSSKWHAIYLGSEAAAHTEYTRLVAEQGILGLLIIIILYLWLPVRHFMLIRKLKPVQIQFLAFLIISMTTMFHAAMRLSMPGVLFGASFILVYQSNQVKRKQR